MTTTKVALKAYTDYLLLNNPDVPPESPVVGNDEFQGSSLDTAGTRFAGARPWAWRNQGTASLVVGGGRLVMTVPQVANSYRIVEQTIPSFPYTVTAKISANYVQSNYMDYGIVLLNSANGKLVYFSSGFAGSDGGLAVQRLNSVTSWNSTVSSSSNAPSRFGGYFKVTVASGVMSLFTSDYPDDESWAPVFTETTAAFLLANPTHVGLACQCNHAGTDKMVCDWWRTSV